MSADSMQSMEEEEGKKGDGKAALEARWIGESVDFVDDTMR